MSRTVANHQHTFTAVVRQRGSRVRYQCRDCPKIGPWIRVVDLKAVPPVTEPVEVHEPEVNQPEVEWETYTLPVLREMAKARGLVGYSRLTKGDLIEQLRTA